MPSFASLFPPNTIIKDFAYSSSHPLRLGNFEVYENNSDDDYDDDYSYHDDDQSPDEINRRAVALFDFTPENDNEVKLVEGQVIWISYRHGQGWLVAEDPATGENGLVPEEYVEVFDDDDLEAVPMLVPILVPVSAPTYPLASPTTMPPSRFYREFFDTTKKATATGWTPNMKMKKIWYSNCTRRS